jgi:hypothetical protein
LALASYTHARQTTKLENLSANNRAGSLVHIANDSHVRRTMRVRRR